MPPLQKKSKKKQSTGGFPWRPIAGIFALLLAGVAMYGAVMKLISQGIAGFGIGPLIGASFFILALVSVGVKWLQNEVKE